MRFPSLRITAAALAAGFGMSYLLHEAERYYSFERAMWIFVHKLGWWWWGIPVVVSTVGLYYAAQLDRPRTRFGFAARIITLMCYVIYIGTPGNPALGPFAAVLAILALTMVVKQLAQSCIARRARPSYKDEGALTRVYAFFTTDLDEVKRHVDGNPAD